MKRCSMLFALALMSAFTFTARVCAQDAREGVSNRSGSIFAEFSVANAGQGNGFQSGGSAGALMQRGILGLVLRGTVAPSGPNVHFYEGVLGPRFAFDLPLLKPFVEAGGGMGRNDISNGFTSGAWGAAWQVAAGVEHDLGEHLRWRVVELAYGHIYAAGGVSPTIISTGFRVHF